MSEKIDTQQLIHDCAQNSRRAQEQLFKLYYGKLMYTCLRYHKDRDTAQEVVQEGFIKIFEKIATFDHTGSFEAWMKRIVVNTAIDYLRKSARNQFTELHENVKEHSDDGQEEYDLELDLNAELALECIQELSPAYRAVFNLYYVEDCSHKEIAEKLGINEGTSKSNLAKAKIRMKSLLEAKLLEKNE